MKIKEYNSKSATIVISKEELGTIHYWFMTSNSRSNKFEREFNANVEKLIKDIEFIEKTENDVKRLFSK